MKYIKQYEQNQLLKKGQFVIYDPIDYHENLYRKKFRDFNSFIMNNIGEVIENNIYYYSVKYENYPPELKSFFDVFDGENITGLNKKDNYIVSDNKEELEALLNARKYNL